MKAFIAGATGALGSRVLQRLVAAGHEVVSLTRSDAGARAIAALGGASVVGDLSDRPCMRQLVAAAAPDVVLQLVNALPSGGPRRFSDLDATNRLRDEGTATLLDAAVAGGATRFVAESVIFSYGYGDLGLEPLSEQAPVQQRAPVAAAQPALDAMHRQEEQVLQAADDGIDGIVLRIGAYYGPVPSMGLLVKMLRRRLVPVPSGDRGRLSFIHSDDAADAVVLAAHHGRPGGIYNVVDDEPVSLRDFVHTLAMALEAKPPLRAPPALLSWGADT